MWCKYINGWFISVVTQIRERTEWLAEMEYLGQAGPHRDIIKDQIAERMRALDALGIDESECSTPKSAASGFILRYKEQEPIVQRRYSSGNIVLFLGFMSMNFKSNL